MKYKVSEGLLKLRAYGRNIQMMVEYAKTIEDEEKRNALVHEIVRIMTNINPSLKENPDYKEKLWDHLYHLADYDIDVNSDYPMPEPDQVFSRPSERMKYHDTKARFRQYGRNVELLIDEARKIDDEEKKLALLNIVANVMKGQIRNQDKDSTQEATVCEHLKILSNGDFVFQPSDFTFYKMPPPIQQKPQQNRKPNKKRKKKSRYK